MADSIKKLVVNNSAGRSDKVEEISEYKKLFYFPKEKWFFLLKCLMQLEYVRFKNICGVGIMISKKPDTTQMHSLLLLYIYVYLKMNKNMYYSFPYNMWMCVYFFNIYRQNRPVGFSYGKTSILT